MPKLIIFLSILLAACQADKLEPTMLSITDLITVEPVKAEYNIGDTIWVSNQVNDYLVEKTNNDTLKKEDGNIENYSKILHINNYSETNRNRIYFYVESPNNINKRFWYASPEQTTFSVIAGCGIATKSYFRYALIARAKGIYALDPNSNNTSSLTKMPTSPQNPCPKYSILNPSFESNNRLELVFQFNHNVNEHLLSEVNDIPAIKKYYERLTNSKLIYWIKVK